MVTTIDRTGQKVYSSGVIVGPRSKTSQYKPGVSSISRDAYNANLAALGNPKANTPEGANAIAAAYNVARQPITMSGSGAPPPPNFNPGGAGGSGGGGGGRGRRGGGGGGGGGGGAAKAAQAQIDAMTRLLGSGAYSYNPAAFDASPYDTMRTNVNDAAAKDQAAATGAYNNLDTWLQANQTNPYANVKVQQAAVAPSYNPYLESQGIAGSAPVVTNPNDGGYGAFQNVLALLGANQQANNASGLRASQEARTYAGQQIGAMDNSYLAGIGNQQTQAQQAYAQQQAQIQQQLAAEKRQAAMQMMALLATPGTTAPDLSALGF
jgi:hypothetical protein